MNRITVMFIHEQDNSDVIMLVAELTALQLASKPRKDFSRFVQDVLFE